MHWQYSECADISVLEEYTGPRKPGHILHIMHIMHILICRLTNNIYVCTTAWVRQCQSAMIYERREQAQVLYVIPVSSILGRLPLVLVGATRTMPFAMQRESATFPEHHATDQRTVVMVVGGGT